MAGVKLIIDRLLLIAFIDTSQITKDLNILICLYILISMGLTIDLMIKPPLMRMY